MLNRIQRVTYWSPVEEVILYSKTHKGIRSLDFLNIFLINLIIGRAYLKIIYG